MNMPDYLEPEFADAYKGWKSTPSPDTNAAMLKALEPVIQKGVTSYGTNDPLTYSRARMLALDSLEKYDPKRSGLQSYMLSNMRGLRRSTAKQQNFVHVPEQLRLDGAKLAEEEQRLSDELGRPPTDNELADSLYLSPARIAKIRRAGGSYATGQFATADSGYDLPASHIPGDNKASDLWVQIVHDDLSPMDQKILEYTLGLNGNEQLSNQEIARRLQRSPGAITQRKMKIQALLDRESELSPFIGD